MEARHTAERLRLIPLIGASALAAASALPTAGLSVDTTGKPASVQTSALTVCGISGEVEKPCSIPCADGISLKDAIEAAGGLTKNADAHKITIIRGGRHNASRVETIRYDPKKVSSGKTEDVTLLPGDLVMIPAKNKGVGFNLGRLLPPRSVQRDIEQFAKKNPVVTGVAVAALGAVAYNNLRPHKRAEKEDPAAYQAMLAERERRYAAIEGTDKDPWRAFNESKREAERARQAAAVEGNRNAPNLRNQPAIDPQKQAQIAQLVALMRSRAQAQAAADPGLQFDSSRGASGLIAQLNSMSQADVNRLMSRPSVWDQFTPYWYKRDGGSVLGRAGVPSGLMRDLTRLDNLGDTATNARVNRQLRQANSLAGLAAGMAAEGRVRNQSQQWFYKNLAEKDYEAVNRGLIGVEARTGISRP